MQKSTYVRLARKAIFTLVLYKMLRIVIHLGVDCCWDFKNILSCVHLLYLRLQAMLASGTILEI